MGTSSNFRPRMKILNLMCMRTVLGQSDPAFTLPDGMSKHLSGETGPIAVTFSVYQENVYAWVEPNNVR